MELTSRRSFMRDEVSFSTSVISEGSWPTEETPPSLDDFDPKNLINSLLGAVIMVINGLTIIIVVRSELLKRKMKILIASLAVTDMLFGFVNVISRMWPRELFGSDPICVVRIGGGMLAFFCTAFNLTLIGLDRALALTMPLIYRTSVTTLKMAVAVAVMWGVSAFMAFCSLYGGFPPGVSCDDVLMIMPLAGLRLFGVTLLLCAFIIVSLYFYIWRQLHKRRRMIQIGHGLQTGINMRVETRTAYTGCLLSVVFLLGYLPPAVYSVWVTGSGVDLREETKTKRLFILAVCPLVSCFLDPILYFWRIRDWSGGRFNRCLCWRKRRRTAPERLGEQRQGGALGQNRVCPNELHWCRAEHSGRTRIEGKTSTDGNSTLASASQTACATVC